MTEQISAKVIAHSRNVYNNCVAVSFELEYPRFIHAEFMTHRMFSRNAASSRAIPVAKVIEQVRNNPAMPVHWGKNQPGMQANEECDEIVIIDDYECSRETAWRIAAHEAADIAQQFSKAGYHKQIVNRLLEPFQRIKVVVTATDYENFYWLRDHPDAQPEIRVLAQKMKTAQAASTPVDLSHEQWHLPYLDTVRMPWGEVRYMSEGTELLLEDAKILSASLCAQVSYRKSDFTIEKAKDIFKRLIESEPCHASPVEHQLRSTCNRYEYGFTHETRDDARSPLYSGNIRGFVQWRQMIPNNVKRG